MKYCQLPITDCQLKTLSLRKTQPMNIFKPFVLAGLLVMMSVFVSIEAYTQEDIKVEQVNMAMSLGEGTGFQVIIPQAAQGNVKKAWIKKVQTGTKSKAMDEGGEISISGAIVSEISPNPMDLYAIVNLVDSVTSLTAFFVIDSAFFDPAKASAPMVLSVKDYIRNFGVEEYKAAVEDELRMEEDKLKEMEKQLANLQKNEEKMEKSIKDEEETISKAEEEIKILEASKEHQLKVIEQKRVAASTVIDKEAKKEANKEIKALEKEREKSDKALSKENESIFNSENTIEESKKAIEEGKEQQLALEEQIELQEEVVEKVKVKLAGIK